MLRLRSTCGIGPLHNLSELGLDLARTVVLLHEVGLEEKTLRELWSYCRSNPEVVIYMPKDLTIPPREAEMQAETPLLPVRFHDMSDMCSVWQCSSRVSPKPTPHTCGNMWAARCSYISPLHRLKMEKFWHNELRTWDAKWNRKGIIALAEREVCRGALDHVTSGSATM